MTAFECFVVAALLFNAAAGYAAVPDHGVLSVYIGIVAGWLLGTGIAKAVLP